MSVRAAALARLLGAVGRIVLAAALVSLAAQPARSSDSALERNVKAAFLYKFAGYVDWPAGAFASPEAPIVLGVAHDPAMADELERIVPMRRIANRPLAVKRLRDGESPAGVHLLFIGATDRARTQALLRAAQPHPVLVVTEIDNGTALGSALNFILSEGRVRFEAAPEAAERAGLKLSSRLLGVAANRGTP